MSKILANKIERSVYNRRRRKLFPFIEPIRQKMAGLLIPYEDYFIVDSMPLEICKLSRSSRVKVCKENFQTAPDKGFSTSQKMHFFGYKLHAVCSLNQVFQSFDLTKASVHGIHFLKNIKNEFSQCSVIGDKGYFNTELDLFESNRITLAVPL